MNTENYIYITRKTKAQNKREMFSVSNFNFIIAYIPADARVKT